MYIAISVFYILSAIVLSSTFSRPTLNVFVLLKINIRQHAQQVGTEGCVCP